MGHLKQTFYFIKKPKTSFLSKKYLVTIRRINTIFHTSWYCPSCKSTSRYTTPSRRGEDSFEEQLQRHLTQFSGVFRKLRDCNNCPRMIKVKRIECYDNDNLKKSIKIKK